MKSPRLLWAALAFAGAPAFAAPASNAPASNSPAVKTAAAVPFAPPRIDARAIAMLDQTVAAYAKTSALSQKVEWTFNFADEKTREGQGSWEFQRPARARLERNMGERKTLVVGNDKTLLGQWGEDAQILKGDPIAQTAEMLFVGPLAPLAMMFEGINPLSFGIGMGWQSATLAPDGKGLVLQAQPDETLPPTTITLGIDPKTHLITRAVYEGLVPAEEGEAMQKYAGSVTLKARRAKFTPTTFATVLPAGQTLESLAPPVYHDPRLVVGARPFALNGQTLDGKTISLDDYKGKVVLLDFWATWCGPCVEELPTVRATYNKYHAQGFEIVGVSRDEEEADLRGFIEKRAMPWPQIFDKPLGTQSNGDNFGVRAIPFTLLIGKDGAIAAVNPRGWHLPLAVAQAMAR